MNTNQIAPDASSTSNVFLSDVRALRERARREIEEGAVTPTYTPDRAVVVRLLNAALATEIVCVLRYYRHHFTVAGIHAPIAAEEFREHAEEERMHAERLALRIVQLGGEPDLSPDGLASRSHSEYVEGTSLVDMIREDLIAERIGIESYKELIAYIGDGDPTTRRLLEDILASEEEHAEDLRSLLVALDA